MEQYESLNHTKWECKYHVVFIPKCRRRTIFGAVKRELGPVFRALTEHKESRVEEGHLMIDHVHMLLAIPPKYAVANVVGYIKARARSMSRGRSASGNATSLGSTSGHAGTLSRP